MTSNGMCKSPTDAGTITICPEKQRFISKRARGDLSVSGYNHKAVPAMATCVVGCPLDLSDCVGRVGNKAHDRHPVNIRARKGGSRTPLGKEKHRGIALLCEGNSLALRGPPRCSRPDSELR